MVLLMVPAAPVKSKHQKALGYTIHVIGVHEDPNGKNVGPIQVQKPIGGVSYFEEHDILAGSGYPWCVDLILTAWVVAGHPLPYATASAYALWDWAHSVGWTTPLSKCLPGDPIVFNIGAGHAATLEKYDPRMGQVHTVDGNHGDKVARAVRSASLVRGGLGIHVPEKIAVPPVPKPYWVITTSENGHRVLVFSKFATEASIIKMLPALLAKFGRSGITIKRGKVRS